MIIGWSLVNNSVDNPVLQFSKAKVDFFKDENLIPTKSRVGLALQWCVDKKYQGKGLIQNIYLLFEALLKEKYDIIEASVRKNNPAGNAATTKLGMQTIFEDDLRIYKIKEITSTSNENKIQKLISIDNRPILIRLGKVGDEIELFELNKKWVIDDTIDNSKGFLTSLYQPEDFKKIIEWNDIVIAETI